MDRLFVDRKSKLPRLWSNQELLKISHLFTGDIVNVSGWRDFDKEGGYYSDYFRNKKSYTITNYVAEARGLQGYENEIFLNLSKTLPKELIGSFDVVLNHTVLEHIFEIHEAFKNLCDMSRDIVILVTPFLQPMHADYGDFWRFTPTCLQKLFEQNRMRVLYCSFNNHLDAGVYVFCVASKFPDKWRNIIVSNLNEDGTVNVYAKPFWNDGFPHKVGTNGILNVAGFMGCSYVKVRSIISSSLRSIFGSIAKKKGK